MKFSVSLLLLAGVSTSSAFTAPGVKAFLPRPSNVVRYMAEDPLPFFATTNDEQTSSSPLPSKSLDEMTLEEEVEILVQKEVAKTTSMSRLRDANGADYAPWMKISEEDERKMRQVMKERAEVRRKRQEQEKSVSGNLYSDSQAQELSGTGLKSKVIDGENVELEWATQTEKGTKGFIVKRRPAKTEGFTVVASFEDWGPLVTKGPEGGVYRYLDVGVPAGGWVYRITECDSKGGENDVCQCLVEVQTQDEQRAALFAAVGIVALGVAAVAAGILLDPMNGY